MFGAIPQGISVPSTCSLLSCSRFEKVARLNSAILCGLIRNQRQTSKTSKVRDSRNCESLALTLTGVSTGVVYQTGGLIGGTLPIISSYGSASRAEFTPAPLSYRHSGARH